MIVVLIGPPGAGKSKQSELLKQREHVTWLSAGQLLRDKNDPEVNAVMNSGGLVKDEVINEMIAEEIKGISSDKVIVLDGFPRHEQQAKWLLDFSKKSERKISLVLHIHLPEEEILERLKLRGRSDDNLKTIEERLEEYRSNILPIVEYFALSGIEIQDIDGNRTVELVFADIDKAVHHVYQSQNK